MSITDELRDWAKGLTLSSWTVEHLTAIANRIDAEHERQCAESWMRGYDAWAAIDRSDEMAEHGWIRLPKDADGEYIHVGDVMETEDNYIRKVDTMQVSSRKWSIGLVATLDAMFSWHDADRLRHHHEPTVEDVLRQVIASANNGMHVHGALDTEQIVAEYAGKLKLASDK